MHIPQNAAKLGLCMIVRNECDVIERCLRSVIPLIDTWTVVDTGSTDGTQQRVREFFRSAGIPGQLHERPWVDFAHNRNQALELARPHSEYLFFIDADEILKLPPGFQRPDFAADAYGVTMARHHVRYSRICIIACRLSWKFVGVLHEYLEAETPVVAKSLDGVAVEFTMDGARSKNPRKFHDDAALLERALQSDPLNPRYRYYLAQSWRDAGETEKAIAAYQYRAALSGWDEENWHALYQAARLMDKAGHPEGAVINAYLRAYEFRPSRAESLVWLGIYMRSRQRFLMARFFLNEAIRIPMTNDRLFVEVDTYGWRRADELAVCSAQTGDRASAIQLWQAILGSEIAPPEERDRLALNIAACRSQ